MVHLRLAKILLFVLTTATPVCFASQSAKRTDKDVTMERGAIGCEVAEATILRIETAKIFLDFHFTLNRLAMVFEYGTNTEFVGDNHVGMWAVSLTIWEEQRDMFFNRWTESYRKKMLTDIWVNFCIDWTRATFDDMTIPMYGALTVSILLQEKIASEGVARFPIQSEIEEQAKKLVTNIYTDWTSELSKTFLVEYEKRSRIHDVKPVENKCMKCREEGTDIVFVMDASNLVTDENWRLQKEFVKKFMKSYKIGKEDNEFLVALVFYGYSQKFFNFVTLLQDYEENEDGIEHAYNLFDRQRYNESSERHLHLGIKQATYMLTHAVHGSRPSGQKIRRAIVVLSSADSAPEYHIQLKYQLAFFDKEVKNPIKIAIGTSPHAGMKELKMIAGENGYAVRYNSFGELENDYTAIVHLTCVFIPIITNYATFLKQLNFSSQLNRYKRSNPVSKRTLTLKGLQPGMSRTLAIPYGPDDVIRVRLNAKRNALRALYSFDGMPPNTKRFDHAEIIMPGKRSDIELEPFRIQNYKKCKVEDTPIDRGPSSGEESNDDDDNELKTICNPGRSCIIMNIFPCGCPPEDPVYDTNQSKTSLTPKRGARKMGRKMRRYAKRGNDKRAKGPDENAEDSPTSRLRSALEICEKKCRARHQKAEDLTIHTFSKRVWN